jgi:peptidase E
VAGGNTFCLREEMRKSGFELIIALYTPAKVQAQLLPEPL